jgi:glycosyltransferase involved in cell wall biosynthesis
MNSLPLSTESPILLAHHWFFQPRGGERVLVELATLLPQSPILTAFATRHVADWPAAMAALLPRVRPSRLQGLYRAAAAVPPLMPLLLPLLPWGMRRSFCRELAGAERLVVSDAGLAKCLALETAAPVAAYLHSPMRHIWHDAEATLGRLPGPLRPMGGRMIERLRRVDREAAGRVARWAVNSETTARRAAAAYGLRRETFVVIPPPVVVPTEPPPTGPRTGLLVVSGMEPYKNDLLAIETARRLGLPLTVVGDGPERPRLEREAGPQARFLGYATDADLDRLYRSHVALLFCGEEDFGIVPVEAMARGCPVVALGRGGVTETVTPEIGGVFFAEPTADAVAAAVEACLSRSWDPAAMHAAAARFAPPAFRAAIGDWLGGS